MLMHLLVNLSFRSRQHKRWHQRNSNWSCFNGRFLPQLVFNHGLSVFKHTVQLVFLLRNSIWWRRFESLRHLKWSKPTNAITECAAKNTHNARHVCKHPPTNVVIFFSLSFKFNRRIRVYVSAQWECMFKCVRVSSNMPLLPSVTGKQWDPPRLEVFLLTGPDSR